MNIEFQKQHSRQ